jgi:hypothetical protein
MGLLNKLQDEGTLLSLNNGAGPDGTQSTETQDSTLHYNYSLNGSPSMAGYPQPTQLGLNGETPPRYQDNLPE